MRTRKSVPGSAVGFIRGLESVGAKPATSSHATIYNRLHTIAEGHGQQLSAGGNAERLDDIFRERLEIEKGKLRSINRGMAQDAAAKFTSFSESIKKRYESNPAARMADILDAQARVGLMDKGQVNTVADELLSGARAPRSEYELIEIIKRAPKHALKDEYARRDDIALWLPEGKAAFAEMQRYATLGDRMAFESEDGEFMSAGVNDLYKPTEYSPREMAERAATTNKTYGDSSVSLPSGY